MGGYLSGIRTPWEVAEIEPDIKAGAVKAHVEPKPGAKQTYPKCGAGCPGYVAFSPNKFWLLGNCWRPGPESNRRPTA